MLIPMSASDFWRKPARSAEAEAFMTQLLNQPGVDRHVRWEQIDRLAQRGSNATAYATSGVGPPTPNRSGNVSSTRNFRVWTARQPFVGG